MPFLIIQSVKISWRCCICTSALSIQGSSKPLVKWRCIWDGSYPYTSYPHLYKVFFFHSSGKTAEEIVRFIMAVRGAEMLVATSFSRQGRILSSPVPLDVLSSLSWRCSNAADPGFKEMKDWLEFELVKHASVLSWFQLRGARKQFLHNICEVCAETIYNSKGIPGCFSIYCDRLKRSWLLRCNRIVGKDFLNSFPEIRGTQRGFSVKYLFGEANIA